MLSPIDPSDVRCQLARILTSRPFKDAPRISRFLHHVVEETLHGRSSRLSVSTIAKDVFDRGEAFSNADSSLVRTTANRLRLVLDRYYATVGDDDPIRISMEPGGYVPTLNRIVGSPTASRADLALQLVNRYQLIADPHSHADGLRILAHALSYEPENVELLAANAELLLDGYVHGFHASRKSYDGAHRMLDRARRVDRNHWRVHFVDGLMALERRDAVAAIKSTSRISRATNHHGSKLMADWLLATARHPSTLSGSVIIDGVHEVDTPAWLHHPFFLAAFIEGDFERALSEAVAFGTPRFHLGYLFRAAAFAQLELRVGAELELKRLNTLYPLFADNPDRYLRTYMPHEISHQTLYEGLRKAGVSLRGP